MFYVPGLLPPVSPHREKKRPEQLTASEREVAHKNRPNKLNDQAAKGDETKEDKHLERSKEEESVAQMQTIRTGNIECPEITPSQTANVEMLLELVGEEDIANMSMDSQQWVAASGFCVDGQENNEIKVNFYSSLAMVFVDLFKKYLLTSKADTSEASSTPCNCDDLSLIHYFFCSSNI